MLYKAKQIDWYIGTDTWALKLNKYLNGTVGFTGSGNIDRRETEDDNGNSEGLSADGISTTFSVSFNLNMHPDLRRLLQKDVKSFRMIMHRRDRGKAYGMPISIVTKRPVSAAAGAYTLVIRGRLRTQDVDELPVFGTPRTTAGNLPLTAAQYGYLYDSSGPALTAHKGSAITVAANDVAVGGDPYTAEGT